MTQPPVVTTQHRPSEVPTAYPIAPVTGLTVGTPTTVPYPSISGASGGPVPIPLPHLVLVNGSPFTLLVAHGGTPLAQIPAYTADDVEVLLIGTRSPVTVTPIVTGALVAFGVDTTVYATWYSADPPGIYPCAIGAGATPLAQTTNIFDANMSVSNVQLGVPVTIPSWVQTISLFFANTNAGATTAVFVQVADASTGHQFFTGVVGLDQWFYLPVNGRSITLSITSMANRVIAGACILRVIVGGMSGPITQPTLQAPGSTNTFPIGAVASLLVAAGTGAVIIPEPAAGNGMVILLRSVSWFHSVAPTAGARLRLRGTRSALDYITWACPGALPSSGAWAGRIYISGSSNVDPVEGLNANNNTSQDITFSVCWDVVPFPFAPQSS